jgi:hypothetical protein
MTLNRKLYLKQKDIQMKFEYEILESTTQTELVNAAKAKFAEFKAIQDAEKLENKVKTAFNIMNAAGQQSADCSKALFDYVAANPKFQAIITLKASDLLPVDKIAFILSSPGLDPTTIILK